MYSQEVSTEVFDASMVFFVDKLKWIEQGALGSVLIVAEKQQ